MPTSKKSSPSRSPMKPRRRPRWDISTDLSRILATTKTTVYLTKRPNMAHKIGHALGFYHEHQREDRNDHVVFNCK